MWYNLCTRNISYTTSNRSGCMNSDANGSRTLACESFLFKHSFTFPHYTSFVLFSLAIFASDPVPWHRSRRYRCCRSISRVCQSISHRDIGPWCTLQIWWISQVWTSLGTITVTTKLVSYSSFSSSNEIDITSLTLNTACSWMTTYLTTELDSNHPKLCGFGLLWVLDQTRREGKLSMGVMEALILLWEKCFLHLLLTFSIFPPLHWVLFFIFLLFSNFFNFPTIFTIIHQKKIFLLKNESLSKYCAPCPVAPALKISTFNMFPNLFMWFLLYELHCLSILLLFNFFLK